ncbi:hypothetical protein ACOMHN_001810 [Nucella lapillus]
MMRSLVTLTDGSFLLGDIMASQPITRVILTHPPQVLTLPFSEPLYDGDVRSLAVVNDHQVLMTTRSFVLEHDVLKLLHLDDSKETIVRVEDVEIPEHRRNSKWSVIAAGPRNGTFFLSGKKADTRKSYVNVITVDGQIVETGMDDLEFQITSMAFNNGELYLMTGWSYVDIPYNLHKVDLASRTFVTHMGALDLTSLGRWVYFFQGGFDSQGNLYVAVENKTGCDNPQEWCCRCVMLITREGEKRIVLNYSCMLDISYSVNFISPILH